MFESELADVTADDVLAAFDGDRCVQFVDPEELATTPIVKLAVKYGLASSVCASAPRRCLTLLTDILKPPRASSSSRAGSTTTTAPYPRSSSRCGPSTFSTAASSSSRRAKTSSLCSSLTRAAPPKSLDSRSVHFNYARKRRLESSILFKYVHKRLSGH